MGTQIATSRSTAVAILIAATISLLKAAGDDPLDPAKTWQLERVGQTWITRSEAEIRRRIALLPEIESRLTAIEIALRAAMQDNAARWKQRSDLERQIEQLRHSSGSAGSTEKAAREEDIRRLEQQVGPLRTASWAPEKLAGVPEVRGPLVELTQVRASALVSASIVRELAAKLPADYRALTNDPRCAEWLRSTKSRLGPLKNYDGDLRKLAKIEELVLGSPLWEGGTPIWIEADRLRLGAIANEHLPVTFTWDESVPTAIVTANWQQVAGLESELGRPKETLRIAGRTFTVVHHRLAYLRLGRQVIRDVDVLVLPPEGEDLGCRIGPKALHGQKVAVEPKQLRLRLLSSDSPK